MPHHQLRMRQSVSVKSYCLPGWLGMLCLASAGPQQSVLHCQSDDLPSSLSYSKQCQNQLLQVQAAHAKGELL